MNGKTLDDFMENEESNNIVSVKTCGICGKDISTEHPNAKYCKQCWSIKTGTFNDRVKYIPNYLDDKTDGIDYVTCKICGHKGQTLQYHIKEHNISSSVYKELYGRIICEKELQRKSNDIKGSKNPAYQHGGKFSPFSEKNTRLSKEKILANKEKAAKSIKNSLKVDSRLEYWLEKTNGNVEEAKLLQSNRQRTFSLEICIKKHGEIEGTRIWKERQEKWQATLDAKSDAEKLEINRKKLYKNGMSSKAEKKIVDILKSQFPEIESQFTISYDITKHYAYDIKYENKIIEYNGDFWHANPLKNNANDIINFPNSKGITAKDVWDRDAHKIATARSNGYDVLVIWEHEFKNNKQETLDRCIKFLKA